MYGLQWRRTREENAAPSRRQLEITIDRTVRSSYLPRDHRVRFGLRSPFSRLNRLNLSRIAKPMVATSSTPLQLPGDEDSAKRRQILDGAGKVFMDLGFDGASMGEIARAAGVSKGTLYVYFADKNRLFEAIVEREMLDQQKTAFNFDPARDVGTTLREFGNVYIALLGGPGGASAIRTVMAIAERMPEVGRRY